ncbi:LytTR family DNA-binding domain-containing protein [Neobacillus sp. PS3-40]|uniref:LytR/AlgR family response regulator transcription factor n=1 Tax=Neobacillus sp. PS3-40 TaxID=3070679 RepID=UPI0027E1ED20|nr:LytTR family DNA-binding domain-containing protein [Neobacillus sp. PS3-40]WML43024.1 LytTR family DNA-binding domain-containing protein [Neobacillus sp. PS3-40]
MKIRVLIVDDEQPAREELAFMLGEISTVELIDEAASGMEAIKKAKEFKPDLIFLDIQLPDLTGLQVAELINEYEFPVQIVFLTAYDHFAIEAFKLRAFHYLLKPYDLEDIIQVFDTYSSLLKENQLKTDQPKHKLAIETQKGFIYLSPKEIFFIEKQGREVIIHTKTEKITATYTLNELLEKLGPFSFFRTHKSYLVNLEHIKELRAWFSGSYNLIMHNKEQSEVPVSRNYVKDLRVRIEL